MIQSFSVSTVGGEESAVEQTIKCHAEVVTLGVERVAGMLDNIRLTVFPFRVILFIWLGYKDVQASHSRMTVRREIQVTIGTERRKLLIAGSVYRFTQILYGNHVSIVSQLCSPYIKPSHSSWHVRSEIKPFAVGRHCGMGEV